MAVKEIVGHHFFDDELNENSIVVDLGAYRGHFSKQIEADYGCDVYAIEASPYSYERTYASAKVKKFHYAICSNCEPVKFFIAENPEGNSIYETYRDANGVFVETKGITLPIFMRENNLPRVDLLKVDIEGAEIDLIKSMSDEELKNINQITLECHDFIRELKIENDVKQLKQRLIALGFGCIVFRYPNKDILFVNKSKAVTPSLDFYTQKGKAQLKMYKRHLSVFLRSTLKK